MTTQEIIVTIIGILTAAAILRYGIRTVRKKDSCSSGCQGCKLKDSCRK